MKLVTFAHRANLRSYFEGALSIGPLTVGVVPFGIIFGAIAYDLGISMTATVAMSAIVFAGSAQFVALGMLAVGSGPLLVIVTSIIVNLRHLIYSAWLAPHLSTLPPRWRALLSFGLTDEVFAIMSRHYSNNKTSNSHWFFLGASSVLWFCWTLSSLIGHVMGSGFPALNELGLEIAMPLTFGSMVVVMIKDRATLLATFIACISAYLGRDLPHQLGLMFSTILGIASGYLASRYQASSGESP